MRCSGTRGFRQPAWCRSMHACEAVMSLCASVCCPMRCRCLAWASAAGQTPPLTATKIRPPPDGANGALRAAPAAAPNSPGVATGSEAHRPTHCQYSLLHRSMLRGVHCRGSYCFRINRRRSGFIPESDRRHWLQGCHWRGEEFLDRYGGITDEGRKAHASGTRCAVQLPPCILKEMK